MKHGWRNTPEYAAWIGMRRRCKNPERKDYPRYGGRGIRVCAEWDTSFGAFINDMGARPGPGYSIDRINHDGHYEPGNVRWATAQQQTENRSNARVVCYLGETLPIGDWAVRLGIDYYTLWQRLRTMPVDVALTKPLRKWTHSGRS